MATDQVRSAANPSGRRGGLWHRDFFLLWQGQTVSQLGNQAFSIAMLYWTLRATGSASLMGLLLAASALPGILLAPIGGAFADRWPRLRIVLITDLLAGAVMAVPALFMLRAAPPRLIVALLFAAAVLLGVLRAFFNPALLAVMPDIVAADRLPAANAANQFAWQGAVFLGQGLGGVCYARFGAALLLLGDAASFLLSAGCTALIRRTSASAEQPSPAPPAPEQPQPAQTAPEPRAGARGATAGAALRRFLRDLREGLRFVRATPGFLPILLGAGAFNFFLMPITVLLPIYVERTLHAGPQWYGFLLAAVGAGSMVGFVLSGLLRLAGRARAQVVVWMMILAPTSFVAVSRVSTRPAALAVCFLLGLVLAVNNVQTLSVLQAQTPADLRGRTLSLLTTIVSGLAPAGMALGGFLGDLTGKNIPLVYTACGLAALLCEALLLARPSVHHLLAAPAGSLAHSR